jgi:hypothetical protein
MVNKLKKLLFAILAFVLLNICIVFYNNYKKENAAKNFIPIEATITSARITKSSRSTQKTILKLEYIYNGQEIEKEISGSTLSNFGYGYYNTGDVITIYINPKNENDIVPGQIITKKNN